MANAIIFYNKYSSYHFKNVTLNKLVSFWKKYTFGRFVYFVSDHPILLV